MKYSNEQIERMVRDNAEKNAEKNADYNPLSGNGGCGRRFHLRIIDRSPEDFYFPEAMAHLPAVSMLRKSCSVSDAARSLFRRPASKIEEDIFWLRLCEARYAHDFEFFAIVCVTIRDKETGAEIPFRLNPAQRMLLTELEDMRTKNQPITVQVLKARQMGFSTLIQMYMKWIQVIHKRNWNSVVCAHDLTGAINIRSMYDFSISVMPPIFGDKMSIAPFANTANIKVIPERGCRITVGTAIRPETVRSQDVKMVHFSEEAFYPDTESNNPELLEASIISSIPQVPYTLIARESTANGVGDYFYEQWQRAKTGTTSFRAIFAPWYMIALYERRFTDGYYFTPDGKRKRGTVADFIGTLTEYETNLYTNNRLCTLENINWRRSMAATMPSEAKMRQEYPSDDIEAFQDSGSPVFKSEDIERMRSECYPPDELGDLVADGSAEQALVEPKTRGVVLSNIRFVSDSEATEAYLFGDSRQRRRGENKLHVWEHPDTSRKISDRYVVVFDPQRGTSESADFGVIKVIDRYWMMHGESPQVVAMWYGRKDKDITIWIAAQIAKYYNNALLVVESNTYDSDTREDDSEFIFDLLAAHYDNIYSRTQPDKLIEGAPIRYGFNTNKKTKPMIISHYVGVLREEAYVERDEETLNEAQTFENKRDGSTGAKQGKHDDRLMATMIGIYVCYQLPIPHEIKGKKGGGTTKRIAW